MISDYNNPYIYQTPPDIKGTVPFLGYHQYPPENHEMKYSLNVCSEPMCGYPPPQCCTYPPLPYMSNPNCPPEQYKVDYVDPPIVKYEYQEPEENFISIDELQYNPALLKMILPDKVAEDTIKKEIQEDRAKRKKQLIERQRSDVKVKAEPIDNGWYGESSKVHKTDDSAPPPTLATVKFERDSSPTMDLPDEIPLEIQIKTEPHFTFSLLADSDEEIDENEEGVEFNWMDLEQQEKREYKCRYCSRRVSSNYNLRRHMMIHSGVRPYGCDICLKEFREFSDLKKHRRSHRDHPNYKCLICRIRSPVDKDGAKCSSCSQQKVSPYGNVYLEELPMIEGFGDKKSFVCPDCGRLFGSRHNLRRHYMIHTGAKPHPCDVCEKSFREVSTLKKHMLIHSRMKMFKCIVCAREYNDYHAFIRHKNSHGDDWRECEKKRPEQGGGDGEDDEDDPLFECNECGKQFADVAVYKAHLRVHSNYFTFQCYICKMTFKKCEKLNSHLVTHSYEVSDSE